MPLADSVTVYVVLTAILATAVCSYAAYWALEIRKGLAVGAYRHQAFGLGIIALAVSLVQVVLTLDFIYPGWVFDNLSILAPYSAVLTIFYWVDASVRTGRRSDPLLRDTFRWRTTRVVIIAAMLGGMIIGFLGGLAGTIGPNGPVAFAIGVMPVFLGLGTAVITLPVVGYRSRDNALRTQLAWFGFFALSILVITVLISSNLNLPYQSLLGQDLGVAVGGLCLYKSSKSLVPLNRISP